MVPRRLEIPSAPHTAGAPVTVSHRQHASSQHRHSHKASQRAELLRDGAIQVVTGQVQVPAVTNSHTVTDTASHSTTSSYSQHQHSRQASQRAERRRYGAAKSRNVVVLLCDALEDQVPAVVRHVERCAATSAVTVSIDASTSRQTPAASHTRPRARPQAATPLTSSQSASRWTLGWRRPFCSKATLPTDSHDNDTRGASSE